MATKYINIKYPFRLSDRGFYIDLNDNEIDAVKSDLLHLILTRKNQRLYNPDFGTDLLKFIFEPEDDMTLSAIKSDITETVKLHFPQLQIDEILVEESENVNHLAIVTLRITINDGVFSTSDIITINI